MKSVAVFLSVASRSRRPLATIGGPNVVPRRPPQAPHLGDHLLKQAIGGDPLRRVLKVSTCHPDSRTSNCNELSSQHFLLADLHPIHARSNSCFDLRQYVRARFSESQ